MAFGVAVATHSFSAVAFAMHADAVAAGAMHAPKPANYIQPTERLSKCGGIGGYFQSQAGTGGLRAHQASR